MATTNNNEDKRYMRFTLSELKYLIGLIEHDIEVLGGINEDWAKKELKTAQNAYGKFNALVAGNNY